MFTCRSTEESRRAEEPLSRRQVSPPPSRSGVAHKPFATEFTAATASTPAARAPREILSGGYTSRRRLDKQPGWLSKFQIRRSTKDLIPVERELPPRRFRSAVTLPELRELSLFLRSASRFHLFSLVYHFQSCISFSVLYIIRSLPLISKELTISIQCSLRTRKMGQ